MEANKLREIAGTILQHYTKGFKQTTWTFKNGKKYKIEISVTPCEEVEIIHDNATNGDVINVLFSDIGIIQTNPYTGIIEIDLDWWNTSYKGGE